MGCFSFLCKVCDQAILSDSFSGDECTLFLLSDGELVQKMSGQYNSYGQVFTDDTYETSQKWDMPWDDVCDLVFEGGKLSGIAATHKRCNPDDIAPDSQSKDDPNQGWGDSWQL